MPPSPSQPRLLMNLPVANVSGLIHAVIVSASSKSYRALMGSSMYALVPSKVKPQDDLADLDELPREDARA